MNKNNRTCYTCGSKYSYCPTCNPHEPVFKTMFCSEVCEAIWKILVKNGTGEFSDAETLEKLFEYEVPAELSEGVSKHLEKLIASQINIDEEAEETDDEHGE